VLGAAAGQIRPLARWPWPLLDCRSLGQERAAAPETMHHLIIECLFALPCTKPWHHLPPRLVAWCQAAHGVEATEWLRLRGSTTFRRC
jgi:hypothetical protein